MLSFIDIHNVAVIEHNQIEFFDGLNVLTGETGAGKSIIIDAISMVLGYRTSRDIIRSGEQKATVSALFYIPEDMWPLFGQWGITPTEDNTIAIYREISADGRGMCRINGRLSSVAVLKEVGKQLINIHGQQDTAELYSAEKHIDLLDGYGAKETAPLLAEYSELYKEYLRLKHAADDAAAEEFKVNTEIDLLTYQINEISALNLKQGEEAELVRKTEAMENFEQISCTCGKAKELISGGDINIRDSLSVIVKDFEKIAPYGEEIEKIYSQLMDVFYMTDDISGSIEALADTVDYDEAELNFMEERIYEIRRLASKYKCSPDGLLDFLEEAGERLSLLQSTKSSSEENLRKLEEIKGILREKAQVLSSTRKKLAESFEEKIIAHLNDLNMKGVKFKTMFTETDLGAKGIDNVEFLISANVGEELRQMAKIASGGELSRIMLALKSIIASYDSVDTYIFDEIDTGISGITSEKVADKLAAVSKNKQTVIITHSPHIAAVADHHFLIKKATVEGKTKTTLSLLDSDGRAAEIARINSGSHLTEAAMTHARELLKIREKEKGV